MKMQSILDQYIQEQGLPECIDSEKAVLSILINNNAMIEALTEHGVTKDHFHSTINRNIYKTCCDVFDKGNDIDPQIVINALRKKYDEEVIRRTVMDLYEAHEMTTALKSHTQNLLEHKIRRDYVIQGNELVQKGFSDNGQIAMLVSESFKEKNEPELTAESLMAMQFKDPTYLVPDTIPENTTLLAGRPKKGKSFLLLNLAVSVACGGYALGKIRVEKRGVLFLALEDKERRLKNRLERILKGEPAPANLYFKTQFKTINDGGIEALDNWLKNHNQVKLVIIDTLAKIKTTMRKNSDLYLEDYACISKLKAISDKHDVALIINHHTRKATSEDLFDTILGTTGISAAADNLMILKKERNQAFLSITGRDIEEKELALKFDPETFNWILLGTAEEYKMSNACADVLKVLKDTNKPMQLKEIAKALGKKADATSHLTRKLADDDIIINLGNGIYVINKDKNNI